LSRLELDDPNGILVDSFVAFVETHLSLLGAEEGVGADLNSDRPRRRCRCTA